MPTPDRAVARGTRRARQLAHEGAREVRDLRRASGLTQADVGRLVGVARSTIVRLEQGGFAGQRVDRLARLAAVLGGDLVVKIFPAGPPVRDIAHLRLLDRFNGQLSPAFRIRAEVPLPIHGDPRAFDLLLTGPGRVAVEAETRLSDMQALERRLALKVKDGGVERLILLVAATRRNRWIMGDHGIGLRTLFPLDSHEVMEALRAGRVPAANGIVFM